jgi:hypothetical protein
VGAQAKGRATRSPAIVADAVVAAAKAGIVGRGWSYRGPWVVVDTAGAEATETG